MRSIAPPVGLGLVEPLEDAGLQQRAGDADRLPDVGELAFARFVVLGQEPAHRDERVAGPVDDVEDHRGGYPHVACQRLGRRFDQPLLVASLHGTMPSGTLRRTSFRRFFGSSATLANCLRFSTSWSGAWTTTVPAVS